MTTPDDWAKALTNFVDEIRGYGPHFWQWSGITPTPEKVVGYLRDHVNYLEQRARIQGAIEAGADANPVAWCRSDDFAHAAQTRQSLVAWGERHPDCDMALYAQPRASAVTLEADQAKVPSRAWARMVLGPTDEEIDVLWDAAGTAQFESVGANVKTVVQTHTEIPGLGEVDRRAVDQFAAAMKLKLSQKSKEGMRGWERATAEYLSRLLREHIHKGDPVDVANFAMMLHQNGQSITPDLSPLVDADALIHTLEAAAEYMEPGSEDRWDIENVAFQLSKLPNRRPLSPGSQDVKKVVEWLQDESGEASYEGRVNMAEHFTLAANLIQEQDARIAELEAKNVELGRVGW